MVALEDKLNKDYISINFGDTGKTSYRGKHFRIAGNFWKNYFGLSKLTGPQSHVIYEDLDELHEYIKDLDENSSYVVRRQEEVNPAAEIYSGAVLIGRIQDSRRIGFKPLNYERPKSF